MHTPLSSQYGIGAHRSFAFLVAAALLLCCVSVPLACTLGPLKLPFRDVAAAFLAPFTDAGMARNLSAPGGESPALDMESLRLIVLDLRLPRVLLALFAGAGLAVAGAVFQGILRNPLADPFTLGVSGGAAFGAALAISFGFSGAAFGFGIPAAAFVGAAAALAAVLMLGRIGGGLRHETLILAGVVVSALLAALIALIKALDESSVTGIVFWIMGTFQGRGWAELALLLPGLVCGSTIAIALHNRLDMLCLGDRTARSLGLGAARLRLVLLLCAGAITASCVAISGIIGFIGLIVPHLCRMLLGAAHGRLLLASALFGALLLLWSDVAARTLLPGGVELPVGVVTALLGGPFFCFILGKKQGRGVARPSAAITEAASIHDTAPRAPSPAGPGRPGHNGHDGHPGRPEYHGQHEQHGHPPARNRQAESSRNDPLLVCRNLAFAYGKKKAPALLDNISFSLNKGEFAALLGPNGSGKSTLLHCLSGELRPRGGAVSILGKNAAKLGEKERARLLALLPQSAESIPALSAYRMALMGRYAHTPFLGAYSAEDHDLALGALGRTGVRHLAARPADTLSGGELQRVLLARAFAQETPLLLLDEAVAGLDPAYQIAVLELLRQKNACGEACILAAMHDLNLAALYCNRLIFIKQGKIIADGPLRETFSAKILEEVYDCRVSIVPHPQSGAPQALLSPQNTA